MAKMTKRQFFQDTDLILEKFHTEVIPFNDGKGDERKARTKDNIFYFAKTYLPHYCENKEFPDFFNFIENEFNKKNNVPLPVCYAAPRGFAKSTYFFFRIMHAICFRTMNFIIYVSANDKLASDFVNIVRLELTDNDRILEDFDFRFRENNKYSFVANGVRVISKSKKGMTRGFKYRQHRPDLIIVDDIEKDEEADSPAIVKKTLSVLKKGLYPALKLSGKLFILGTIVRKRSVLDIILNSDCEPYTKWTRKVFNAICVDEKGKEYSLWKDRFPIKKLQEIKENIGSIAFESEYQNTPTDDENSLFQESWIKYYEDDDIDINKLIKVMFIDPSIKSTKKADYKAMITIGLDKSTMNYYVLESWIKKTSIENMLKATFRLYEKYRHNLIGFESNGFQILLKELYDELEKEYKISLPLKLVEHYHQSKNTRIAPLSPLMERGKLFFNAKSKKQNEQFKDDTKLLIEQFLYYPQANVNDDGPDATAEGVNLLHSFVSKNNFVSVGSGLRESSKLLKKYKY